MLPLSPLTYPSKCEIGSILKCTHHFYFEYSIQLSFLAAFPYLLANLWVLNSKGGLSDGSALHAEISFMLACHSPACLWCYFEGHFISVVLLLQTFFFQPLFSNWSKILGHEIQWGEQKLRRDVVFFFFSFMHYFDILKLHSQLNQLGQFLLK